MKNYFKSLVSIVLTFAMLVGIVPEFSVSAETTNSNGLILVRNIFKDSLESDLVFTGWNYKTSIDSSIKQEGEASLKIDSAPNTFVSASMKFISGKQLSVSNELRETGGLHFWAKIPSYATEMAVSISNYIDNVRYVNKVNLKDFIKEADINKWVEVSIPFTRFSDLGETYIQGQRQTRLFKWDSIGAIEFIINTTKMTNTWTMNIDDLTVMDGLIKRSVKILPEEEYYKTKQNFTSLDLKSVVNMGFADEVAGDGKGGWTDQGPENDLRSFNLKGVNSMIGIPFDIIDPASNNGKSSLILRGQNNLAFPTSAEITVNSKFAGAYFLHAASWATPKSIIGRYRIIYEDGGEEVVEIINGQNISDWWSSLNITTMRVGWTGSNLQTSVISLFIAPVTNPRPDAIVKKIIAETDGNKGYLMLVAATLTDAGPYFPALPDVGNPDTAKWFAYEQPTAAKLKGTPLDVSFLLDTPAGKHGFLQTKNGGFYFEDGTKGRFWGANLSGAGNFRTYQESEELAERMAQSGWNLARLHALDGFWMSTNIFGTNYTSTKKIDQQQLDKVFYLIAQLKKRGIYVLIDLMAYRKSFAADGIASIEDIGAGWKFEGMFDPYLIELQKEFIKQLLTQVNPYTGLALVNDPVLAMLDLYNEATLVGFDPGPLKFNSTTPYYQTQLQDLFNKWLRQKYKNREALEAAWNAAGTIGLNLAEDPIEGTVLIADNYAKSNFSDHRKNDVLAFLADTQSNYNKTMIDYLRSIEVKIAVTGNSFIGINQLSDIYVNSQTDFLDRHGYWSHPVALGPFDPPVTTTNLKSMITSSGLGLMGRFASNNAFGKPMIVSEWQAADPNPTIAEAQLLMASYSAYQGWHSTVYAFTGDTDFSMDRIKDVFYTYNNPAKMATIPAASIIYQRQDVQEAPVGYFKEINKEQATDLNNQNLVVPTGMVAIAKTGLAFTDDPNYDPNYNDNSLLLLAAEGIKTGKLTSVTEELEVNIKQGVFKLNTPNSQAVSGYAAGSVVSLNDMDVKLTTPFAVVILNSLTKDPILDSERMLVSTTARARNTDELLSIDGSSVRYGGRAPVIVEPVEGEIMLKTKALIEVYSLTSTGQRKEKIEVVKTNEGYSKFQMTAAHQALYYEIIQQTVPVGGVELSSKELFLSTVTNNVYQLKATVLPFEATNKKVIWTTGDPNIVTVDQSGIVTAVSNGKTTVTVKTKNGGFQDTAGIIVDSVPPVTTGDASQEWRNTAQTVKLSAADALSGVAKTYYSIDNGEWMEGNVMTIGDEGIHAIRYYSVDRSGNNEDTKSAVVKIDKTLPVVQGTVSSTSYRTDTVPVTISITDALSGVAHSIVKLDGFETTQNIVIEPYSLSLGEHVIEVTASDAAGNVTVKQFPFTVTMDIDHLDEAANLGYDKGWIKNKGILNSLLGKIDNLQKQGGDNPQTLNGLNALENKIQDKSGKQIVKSFADALLADIAYLKQLYK